MTALARVLKSAPRRGYRGCKQLRVPPVGARGYQRFPLSKPVVDHNIAFHAVSAYRTFTYLLPSRLIQLHVLQMSPRLQRWIA